jgi:tetratricopeptide (TPR) repeat protein
MNKSSFKLVALSAMLMAGKIATAQTMTDVLKMYNFNRYETVKTMVAKMPATAENNYYNGLAELGLGNVDAAKSAFAKFPADIANMCGQARVLFAQNKPSDAMALIKTITATAKKKDWQTLKLAADAITYSEGGDLLKAVDLYRKVTELSPTGDNYMAMGDAFYNIQNGGGDAFTSYDKALENKGNPTLLNYRLGDLWYSARQYDSAIAFYNRSITADPTNPLPYYRFSNAYYKINKYELAKQNIQKYLANSDNSLDDQLRYANILFLSGDYKGTSDKMNELVGKGVDKPYMYRLLGYSNYETGAYSVALQNMDKFFAKQEAGKVLAKDYQYYGKILAKTPGREADALTNFQKSIDIDTAKDKSESYRTLAEDFKNKKDWTNAASWYAKLISTSPEKSINMTDYFYAGFANYASNNNVEAKKYLSKMNALYPDEPSGYYYNGMNEATIDKGVFTGSGLEPFNKYIAMVGTNPDKKDNVIKAYSYIVQYYYNKKDVSNGTDYCNKLLALDPTNKLATQVLDFLKNPKATTTETKTTKTTEPVVKDKTKTPAKPPVKKK